MTDAKQEAETQFRQTKILPVMTEKHMKDTVRLHYKRRQVSQNWPLCILKASDLLILVTRSSDKEAKT